MNIFAPSALLGIVSLLVSPLSVAQDVEKIWVTIDPIAAKHYKLNQTAHHHNAERLTVQDSPFRNREFYAYQSS